MAPIVSPDLRRSQPLHRTSLQSGDKMRAIVWGSWREERPAPQRTRTFDKLVSLSAVALLCTMVSQSWIVEAAAPEEQPAGATKAETRSSNVPAFPGGDRVIAGYVGAPFYYRSNVHLTRSDGTD